jgi:hypothetical protein
VGVAGLCPAEPERGRAWEPFEGSHLDDALRVGKLSYAKVRALTRVATPENEARLLELALYATGVQARGERRALLDADHRGRVRELLSGFPKQLWARRDSNPLPSASEADTLSR